MAKLLSDRSLRERFRNDASDVANELQLDETTIHHLRDLDVEALEDQALTLINKRWRAVAELVPGTVHSLGESAYELFVFYAQANWPEGHLRHPQDALDFLRFLESNDIHRAGGRDTSRLKRLIDGR